MAGRNKFLPLKNLYFDKENFMTTNEMVNCINDILT